MTTTNRRQVGHFAIVGRGYALQRSAGKSFNDKRKGHATLLTGAAQHHCQACIEQASVLTLGSTWSCPSRCSLYMMATTGVTSTGRNSASSQKVSQQGKALVQTTPSTGGSR